MVLPITLNWPTKFWIKKIMDKTKRKMGLGRGLDAIFSEKTSDLESNNVKEDNISSAEVALHLIDVNPFQPRTHFDPIALEELKVSIQTQGIIQPIAVRKLKDGKYQLISGERRFQASKLAGLSKIPVYVKDATDIQMLEMGIIENIQRENLNPVEIAQSFQRLLKECNIKQEELGSRVGKDRSTVNNYLRLLQLPQLVLDGLNQKKLSMGHARALLALDNKNNIAKVYNEISSKEYSVRKVEELVKKLNTNKTIIIKDENKPEKKKKISLDDYETRLSGFFSNKVLVLSDDKNKGEIKIPFASREELDNILLKLKK